MNETKKEIIDIITEIWNDNEDLRFGQLLTSLNVLEFANKAKPRTSDYNLRDIFADTDKSTLKRIKTSHLYLKHKNKEC